MRTEKVRVEKWNPRWPEEFDKIVEFLGQDIQQKVIRIEHVGSTSVEGLSAKPIIDLDIVIEKDQFSIIKALLEAKGYGYEGDLGIEGREAFACPEKSACMIHHLYVCAKESEELHRHLTFRNYLREHPEAVTAYSKVKEKAALLYPHDIDRYMAFKSTVIEEIYKQCGLL